MPSKAWKITLGEFSVVINAGRAEEALEAVYLSARSIPREAYEVKEIAE
jgi:hypothetical protein